MQHSPPPLVPKAQPVQSPADLRAAEILAAVRQTFVDKGFDGASMQDLARAAGISVGNFYRYFPSKAAIIQALIRADSADMKRDFDRIMASEQPLAQLRLSIEEHVMDTTCAKDMDLWAEIEAAARRTPEIAQAARQMEAEVIANFAAVFGAELGLPPAEAQARFSALATYVLVQVKAATCLTCAAPQDQTEVRRMILANINQGLDEAQRAHPDPTSFIPL